MTDPAHPAPSASEVVTAVETVLAREVERVDDPATGSPGGDPSDSIGWYPYDCRVSEDGSYPPARPIYDEETWRWFHLLGVTYLDGLVLIEFRWTDPTTPELRHIVICSVNSSSEYIAAYSVRTYLRRLLVSGWRDHAARVWLGPDRVLLQPDGVTHQRSQQIWDQLWTLRDASAHRRRQD